MRCSEREVSALHMSFPDLVRFFEETATLAQSLLSKLFRNVPFLTHERMSPSLFVVRGSASPAGGAGRREV